MGPNGLSYPEFSFGAVGKKKEEEEEGGYTNSTALPSSGASLHPMTPVPSIYPGFGGTEGSGEFTPLLFQRIRWLGWRKRSRGDGEDLSSGLFLLLHAGVWKDAARGISV